MEKEFVEPAANAALKEQVSLESLVGEHVLTAVDLSTEQVQKWGDAYEDCNVIRFRLDGKIYTAVEDPSDGYRSSMEQLFASDGAMQNEFAPVRVLAKMKASDSWRTNETLELVDLVTGKVVLEVGTDNSDDYYPSFVGAFWPENMTINTSGSSAAGAAPTPLSE